MHQMPAASDPLGADQMRVPRSRASHRQRESYEPQDGDTRSWDGRGKDAGSRVVITPETPIVADPYLPRPNPWTAGSSSWSVRGETWTTGAIPATPTDRPYWFRSAQAGGIAMTWLLMILLAAVIGRSAALRPAALFAHIIFLAIGFGAVLAIGLNGLALMLRWVRVSRVVTVAVVLDPLLWTGLAGLCLSGIVLGPDLSRGWTWVKLLAVLAVAVNGLWNRDLMAELGRLPGKAGRRSLSPALLRRAVRLSATSQVGWWIAVVIGFVSTNG